MKSQQAILKSAKKLFWKYGIRKVTVEEICKEAGISKMTFYRRYVNKDHAAEELLEEILQKGLRQYDAIMSQNIPFPDKISEMLELKARESKDISQEFLKDILTDDKSGLSELIMKYRQKSLAKLLADFEKARKEGWIREDVSTEFLKYIYFDLNQKLQDPEFLKLYKTTKEAIMAMTDFFFYGIFSKGNQ